MVETGFWWVLLACAVYGAVHSLLAAHRVKALAAYRFGAGAYRRFYRLFFSAAAVVTTLPLLALPFLLPDRPLYRIPAPWVYLSLLLQGAAALALLAGVLQTGLLRFLGFAQALDPNSPASAEKLVVSGLYRWVRHPLYTAALVLIWLLPVMTWNLLALNIGLTAYLLIGTIYEERKLVAQFSEEYKEYQSRTPRIIPGLRLRR